MADVKNPWDKGADLLKLLRGRWVTRYVIERDLGWGSETAKRWVQHLEEHGFLVSRVASPTQQKGPVLPVVEYTVAPAWVGEAR